MYKMRDVFNLSREDNILVAKKYFDLEFLKKMHRKIMVGEMPDKWLGKLRDRELRVPGTNYVPKVPIAEKVRNNLKKIMLANMTSTDKAVTVMLYIMRSQLFLDGNKRVGTLACNQILVARGRGIFSLPPELKEEFSEKLVRFYGTDEMGELKQLIEDKCLIGL